MLKRSKFRWYCAFLIVMVAGLLLSYPVAAQDAGWLSAPSGPYAVGITTFHWIDGSRPESFTSDPDDQRELMVQVWYPAVVDAEATPEPYLAFPVADFSPPATVPMMLPDITFDLTAEDLVTAPTHSYRDAPMADAAAPYPVLIFSHGWMARPEFFTAQMENLASHGYVVAGIVHTHITLYAIFPNQRFVLFSNPDFDLSVEVGAQDQSFVLDQLTLLNNAPDGELFSGHLALDRVGSFGHSWGSYVTTLACLQDNRFKVAIPVDGRQIPDQVEREGLDIPIMFMMREGRTATVSLSSMRGPAYNLIFEGFGHNNFTDFTLYPGVSSPDLTMIGDIDGPRAAYITHAYQVAFLDQYLKGEPSPLLDGPSPDFPEVTFEARNLAPATTTE